ncbi:Ubiquitin carboxyl-terminal hydrolase 27, partial [Quillaja saponaria]
EIPNFVRSQTTNVARGHEFTEPLTSVPGTFCLPPFKTVAYPRLPNEGAVSMTTVIRNLSYGFGSLSPMVWSRASVVCVVGIVSVILGLKDAKGVIFTSLPWPFERGANHLEKIRLVPGLQNLGNNCFFNVILQALASCFCFQSFLQKVIGEHEIEELVERMPLTVALATILEELCAVGGGKVVLSPRRVMLAMAHYTPNFNLTSQQDSAEAFLHLFCSLREEFEDCYVPKISSLADLFASNCRVLIPRRKDCSVQEWQTERERWQQFFLGPFDGILGSILTCQSCSSQISMSFESFHSLPLSPVLQTNSTVRFGCTLVDCLRQFFVAEHVENYHCSHCWHIAAIKYLSLVEGTEIDIEKLRGCNEQDFCDCQKLSHLEELPWSKRFSRTLKQLSIARCPKILCIQLKRVSIDGFGGLIKLQGHISFPLILDIFPFMTTGVGIKKWEEDVQTQQVELQNRKSSWHSHFDAQLETRLLNGIYGPAKKINSKELVDDRFGSSPIVQEFLGEPIFPSSGVTPNSMQIDIHMQATDEVDLSCELVPEETRLYQLVSVVEHFGRAGSGHYTVYRCVTMEAPEEEPDDQLSPNNTRWFCISDSEVHPVSEAEVLAAEASMLFYEKIAEG